MVELNKEGLLLIARESMKEYNEATKRVSEIQEQVLMSIIKENKETVFGKQYDFESINCKKDFVARVPIHGYDDLKPFIEENKLKDNIALKRPICYWAMTSGTSGTHKYIPHSKESLGLWNKGVLRALAPFVLKNEDIDVFQFNYIFIVGPAFLETINSIPAGYISGIIPSVNDIAKSRNITPDSVNKISNYHEKMATIFKLSLEHPIMAIGGISTFTINFINYVHEYGYEMAKEDPKYLQRVIPCLNNDNSVNVNLLWPHLKFFLSTGVSIDSCKNKISKFFPDIWMANLYAGTEGAYGFSMQSMGEGLHLNFDLYYFEFRDMDTDEVFTLGKVKKNTAYEVIITCPNGLYRYTNGDLIEFLSIEPPIIKVLGRSNLIINLAGEKLSDSEINAGVTRTLRELRLSINGYCFFGWVDSNCFVHHCIVLEVSEGNCHTEMISNTLFKNLKEIRVSYRRAAEGLFKAPHVIIVKESTFKKLEEKISNKKGVVGHSKIKHIYTFDEITKLIEKIWIEKHNVSLDIINSFK